MTRHRVLAASLVVVAVLLGLIAALLVTVRGLPPGTTLAGVPISDPQSAPARIAKLDTALQSHSVVIRVGSQEATRTLGQLGFRLNTALMITDVQQNVGVQAWLRAMSGSTVIPIQFDLGEPASSEKLIAALRTEVRDGAVMYDHGDVTVTKPVVGRSVRMDAIHSALRAKLLGLDARAPWPASLTIEPANLSVTPSIDEGLIDRTVSRLQAMLTTPLVIEGKTIKEGKVGTEQVVLKRGDLMDTVRIVMDPSNAMESQRLRIVKAVPLPPPPPALIEVVGRGSVYPGFKVRVDGRSPVPARGASEGELTAVSGITGTLVAEEGAPGFMASPELTYYQAIDGLLAGKHKAAFVGSPIASQDLASIGVRKPISTYTTFYPAGQSRVQNIKEMAKRVSGTIIPAGSSFELNHFVGQRTREKGFTDGGAIVDGRMVTAVGGGVSQFATTMFNAMWFSGVELVEFHPHSYYFTRYPLGREATINYPNVNLEMRNNTPYAILVEAIATDTSITVTFWSTPYFEVTQRIGPVQPTESGSRVVIERTVTNPQGASQHRAYTVRYKRQ